MTSPARESDALAESAELMAFCRALELFVNTGRGEATLEAAARALAGELRLRHLPPERVLTALAVANCRPSLGDDGPASNSRERSRRYVRALERLLGAYFDETNPGSDREVVGPGHHIDVALADFLVSALEPALSEIEHALVLRSGEMPPAARLSAALRATLEQLGHSLNQETFDFLRWKVSLERESTAERRREVAFRDGARVVEDLEGHRWDVFPMIEGLGWDGEVSVPRENWLCFATPGERRYLTPLPADWESWNDDELRAALAAAPVDKRRY